MKEIVQLNYIKTEVESFEIGDKRQLELYLLNDGENKINSTTDNYDVDDADDKDNYKDDVNEENDVTGIDKIIH